MRSVKYRSAPTAASKEPMKKVKEIVESTLIPISLDASVSFETARIAMPIFVWLISCRSMIVSTTVRIGVRIVTREVVTGPNVRIFFSPGISG